MSCGCTVIIIFIEECANRLRFCFFCTWFADPPPLSLPCRNQSLQHTDGYLESDLEPSRSKFRARLEEVSQPTSGLEGELRTTHATATVTEPLTLHQGLGSGVVHSVFFRCGKVNHPSSEGVLRERSPMAYRVLPCPPYICMAIYTLAEIFREKWFV